MQTIAFANKERHERPAALFAFEAGASTFLPQACDVPAGNAGGRDKKHFLLQ
jgi:hypothetical protein